MSGYEKLFTEVAYVVSKRGPWTAEREAELRALYPDYEIRRLDFNPFTGEADQ